MFIYKNIPECDIEKVIKIQKNSFEENLVFSCDMILKIYRIGCYHNNKLVGIALISGNTLLCLAVIPEYRSKSIGEILLRLSLKCGVTELQVNTLNTKALNLYIKCGFKSTKYIKDYYGNNKNAYKMNFIN